MLTTNHSLSILIYVMDVSFHFFCQPYFLLGQSRPLEAPMYESAHCWGKDKRCSHRISKCQVLNIRLSTWQHITVSLSWLDFSLRREPTLGTRTGAFFRNYWSIFWLMFEKIAKHLANDAPTNPWHKNRSLLQNFDPGCESGCLPSVLLTSWQEALQASKKGL